MAKEKVFCENCIFYKDASYGFYCKNPDFMQVKETPVSRHLIEADCFEQNENNNCRGFKDKKK